ncbi:PAS domain-containing sensor histidine kinase [Pedobacter sp. SYSU D00535]|uniref:sensor histidine kinase n=1 Tax=Pedobacter sp. SYSU D00535 TaxID=2810308 RepID=UPI001A96385F|nr:PAS domain-containing sensor histidine kinase [Pedobacter sp. SYSU D00535]
MDLDTYGEFLETLPLASFLFDLSSGKVVYNNTSLRRLLGTDLQDFSAGKLIELVPQEDRAYLKKRYSMLRKGSDQRDLEFRIYAKDGKERWLRLSATLVEAGGRECIVATLADISPEITNLHQYKKFANKKDSILQILAHDLRGPLGTAQMATTAITARLGDSELVRLTRSISSILKQSIDLISDLTEREFLETAEVVLVKSRIDVVSKIKEWFEECQKAAGLSNRVFKFLADRDRVFLTADEGKIIQIFNNLLTNALKFTRDGGTISLSIEEKQNSVMFSVADDGIGIPDHLQSSLFEKYTEAGRAGLQGEPSIGLGMYIVKTIVEWHHGTIWVESKENQGTTVFFELPKA